MRLTFSLSPSTKQEQNVLVYIQGLDLFIVTNTNANAGASYGRAVSLSLAPPLFSQVKVTW